MRVLVTGGAGFIGSHTARALVTKGHEVRVLDALTQPVHPPGYEPLAEPGIEFVRGDVRDKGAWTECLAGVDAVMHFAAYQDYGLDFSRFTSVNVTGTALLYEVIVEQRLEIERIVLASSESVYGEGQVRCADHGVVAAAQRTPDRLARGDFDARCSVCDAPSPPEPMTEEFAAPHNAYGTSKLAAERLGLVLGAHHGLPTVALRYAIVHGPGQSPRNAYSGLLRAASLALLAGQAPVLFEDGEQRRDYIGIDDVVAANLLALEHPDAPGRAYNVGGARSWTVREVVDALNQIVDDPREPELPGLHRVGDVRHTIGDLSGLRALGWEPRADLVEVWRGYWSWLRGLTLPGEIVSDALSDMRNRGILRPSDI